jgi:hypothetical protein
MMFTAAAYKNIFRAFVIIFCVAFAYSPEVRTVFFSGSVVGDFAESRRWTFAQTKKIFARCGLVTPIVTDTRSRLSSIQFGAFIIVAANHVEHLYICYHFLD